ncbi:MAG: spore cortex biosynthesis protein YabQ [Bacillota bacterium]|nr:spore cortex biosynthesis protein YabQ [Bacillota bacterium]
MPVDVQLYQFSVMLLAGMALGAFFDVYRTFRLKARPGAGATVVLDALFWVIATLLLLGAVFYASWGEVRVYVFVGAATGAWLYFKLASSLVLRLLRWVWRVIGRLLRLVQGVLYYVLVVPVLIAYRVVARVLGTVVLPFIVVFRLVAGLIGDALKKEEKPPIDS